MKLSVVIAAYDERENIEELARQLDGVLRGLPDCDPEMIFVVEGSDGTREILESLATELGGIRVFYSERPSGLGNAFRRGFQAVSPDSDYILTMDADFNHDPAEIPRLLEQAQRKDLDVLVGSRFIEGSRTEGIPLWKRCLSVLMNRCIAALFDVETKDKTSGFRVYRASALPQLVGYRNANFAFLPEILIRANDAGLRIGEIPIHFTYRTRGQSKMSILQTSRSYLSLLRSRFDGWSVAALVLLLLGTVVRVLYAFPVHHFAAEADSMLTALRALDIREGHLRVFYSGVRLGALESYLHLIPLAVLGIRREAVVLAPLAAGLATLPAFFFFVRKLLGREVACFALIFMALPPPAFLAWTYTPNGYGETVLLCVCILWLAARIAKDGTTTVPVALLGFCVGLGVWNSLQTLTCAVPALAWLVIRRRDLFRNLRPLALAGACVLIGATPWIAYNVRHPLASVHETSYLHPAGGAQVPSNVSYLLRYQIGELTVGLNPFEDSGAAHALKNETAVTQAEPFLRVPAAFVVGLGILMLLVGSFLSRNLIRQEKRTAQPGAFLLLQLTAAGIGVFAVLSQAGNSRGLTVRYVLPLQIVLAAAMGAALLLISRASRVAAVVLAALPVAFALSGYYLPWTPQRRYWKELGDSDLQLARYLEANGVTWACGNYWVVYPMRFTSREKVLGIPFQADADVYGFSSRLPAAASRWALVTRGRPMMKKWVREAHLEGRIVDTVPRYFVFLPTGSTASLPSWQVLSRVSAAAPQPGY